MLLSSWPSDVTQEYELAVDSMKEYDQNTLFVDFSHLSRFDGHLANTVADEFYRFEPFLREAVFAIAKERHGEFAMVEGNPRDFFVAFYNMQAQLR